jgi:hypothetical protein
VRWVLALALGEWGTRRLEEGWTSGNAVRRQVSLAFSPPPPQPRSINRTMGLSRVQAFDKIHKPRAPDGGSEANGIGAARYLLLGG